MEQWVAYLLLLELLMRLGVMRDLCSAFSLLASSRWKPPVRRFNRLSNHQHDANSDRPLEVMPARFSLAGRASRHPKIQIQNRNKLGAREMPWTMVEFHGAGSKMKVKVSTSMYSF